MRFKRRNVLYVPGVGTVHGSTYAPSSARQRHSRGPPPPRWCPPQEASCTSPSANPKTGQGTHLSRGSMSFANALRRAAHCGPSDMECTLTFLYHQEFSKKSSGEQSYDLERDLSTILSAETRTGANMPHKIPQNTTFRRPLSPYLYVTLFHLAPFLTSLI
jgi:hypothetical protein